MKVGILVLDYAAESGEDPIRHTPLAVALAEQVALALQNAGLYADAETRRREAEVMAEVVAAVNASSTSTPSSAGSPRVRRAPARWPPSPSGSRPREPCSSVPHGGDGGRRSDRPPALGTDDRGEAHALGEEYVAVMRQEGLLAVLVGADPERARGSRSLLYVGNPLAASLLAPATR